MDESLFLRVLLKEKIKVTPAELSSDVRQHIVGRLVAKCEGKCTKHGYIRRGSLEVLKVSLGRVDMATLNGDVVYVTQFSADVCNPCVGSTLKARVVNSNRFGLLAEAGVRDGETGAYTSVLDIIIAKQTVSMKSEVDLESIRVNDEVVVEVMGKKFDLDDQKLSIVGRVLRSSAVDALRPTVSVTDGDAESLADIDSNDDDDALISDKEDLDDEAVADEDEILEDEVAEDAIAGEEDGAGAEADADADGPAQGAEETVVGSEPGDEESLSGFASDDDGDFFDGDGDDNDDEF